jgi:hypothetical protein
MPHPSTILITSIQCLKTDDFTGADELTAVIGADSFSLGTFSEGTDTPLGLNRMIAPGATELVIIEKDLTGDDELARIDLTVDMDVERVFGVLGDRARYDIVFTVTSEPDL